MREIWRIEPPTLSTLLAWRKMRQALWPEMTEEENASETQALMGKADTFIRIAWSADDRPAGFAEATLRVDYVNGCVTSPVAFLEGIYVEPWARRQGVARVLVGAVEVWARQKGCSELASDALLENAESHHMHAGLGFEETERVVYFRKVLAH
jgi:aminoglycoside 6'-N-acetyltransferase I